MEQKLPICIIFQVLVPRRNFYSLRILLTVIMSMASGVPSFSKLNLIKTFLRSTLSRSRPVDKNFNSISVYFLAGISRNFCEERLFPKEATKSNFDL